jgi:hypothetical protein
MNAVGRRETSVQEQWEEASIAVLGVAWEEVTRCERMIMR